MEAADRDLISRYLESDSRLKRLYQEHEELENRLVEYSARNFLTVDEEMEQKRLKKQKLYGVDQMMAIVGHHLESVAAA